MPKTGGGKRAVSVPIVLGALLAESSHFRSLLHSPTTSDLPLDLDAFMGVRGRVGRAADAYAGLKTGRHGVSGHTAT